MQKLLKIAVASLVVTLMASGTVSAAQRMVNTTVDDPNLPGSLRFEIRFAQNGDTILFDQGLLDQQIVLKAEYGPLYIYKALSIVGDINQDGFADVSISGNNLTSLVYAMGPSSGEVVLEGLDLRDGYSKYSGGCIRNYSYGPLVIRNSIITHCEALRDGGAIYNVKTLVVEGSVIAENKAVRGAGIVTFSGVQPIISESEFHHNFSTRWGGAIYSYGDGILQIDRSMISDNYARGAGAGVFLHGAAPGFGVIINDSTINSNFCEGTDTDEDLEGVGGGISAGGRGSVVVNNSTISHNSAGRDGGGIML